jgi:hypothetical protein
MPSLNIPTGGGRVAVAPQTLITPVVTPTMALFLTKLAVSKAAGVEAIRLTRVNNDIHLEELNAHGERMIGFVMHPLLNNAKKVTAVAVTQMGGSGTPLPLTPAQKTALRQITNELKQFRASGAANPPATGRTARISLKGILEAVDAGIACGAAGAELGMNPIADAGCIVAVGAMTADDEPSPPPPEDPGGIVIDIPPNEDPGTRGSNTSQDGGEDYGDGGGGGGRPLDDDDKDGHKED